MDKNLKVMMMFEMMGKPEKYLEESMEKFVEALGVEKNIKILDKQIYPTKKVENRDKEGKVVPTELFSTFCEVRMEFESLIALYMMIFKYMPSHIEVEYPEEIEMTNIDLNNVTNEIITRLHNYDAVAKGALMNNQILASRLKEIMEKNSNKSSVAPVIAPLEISYGKEENAKNTENKNTFKKNKKEDKLENKKKSKKSKS